MGDPDPTAALTFSSHTWASKPASVERINEAYNA